MELRKAVTVLVTGGSGFIGKYIVAGFSLQGCHVFSTYKKNTLWLENKIPHVEYVYTDFYNLDKLPRQYDVLVHCGAVNPGASSSEAEMYATNAQGSENIFLHAAQAGAKLSIYLSSVSVYGDVKTAILRETHPIIPNNAYGCSKFQGEAALFKVVEAKNKMAGLTLRLPGVVGPGSRNNFLSRAFEKILNNETVTAENPQELFNNIVYINDLTRFIIQYSQKYKQGYHVSNMASENPITIDNVFKLIQEFSGRRARIQYVEPTKKPFLISLDKIKELGYCVPTAYESLKNFVLDSLVTKEYS